MVDTMRHQSHYRSSLFSCPGLGIYAGQIAQDETRRQSNSGHPDVSVLMAGECFADSKLDGDAILSLYQRTPTRFPLDLNGLFSGLLIDERKRKACLFNDRYGTERIYWHQTRDELYFASEAKALLLVVPELRQFDHEGVAQFLTLGCTVNWRSLFRGVEILPGGSLWTFTDTDCKKERYFDARTWESLPELPLNTFQIRFEETFKRVLPRYFETDIPLGVSLTGGLDTRMILACKPANITPPVSYTFTGADGETFDDRVAAEVSHACGLKHHLLRLGRDFFADFPAHADRTVYLTDGCFGITGAHEIYFNKQARQLAPVRLTGLFGSEILRGISTFKAGRPPQWLLQPELNGLIDTTLEKFASIQVHPVTSAAFRNIPWNLFGGMAANRSQVMLRSPYLDNELVSLAFQAPAIARTSPQPALRLIEHNNRALSLIPTDRRVEDKGAGLLRSSRRLFREAGFKLDYYYNEGMPQWGSRFDPFLRVLNARCKIFGYHKFLHYRSWFRTMLAPYVIEVLRESRTQESAFWMPGALNYIVESQLQGRGNYVSIINAVLTLEAVERLLFRELPTHTMQASKGIAINS